MLGLRRLLLIIACALLLQACSSSSVFKPYPDQAAEYKAAINSSNIAPVADKLAKQEKKKDGLLYAQERGRLYQLNHQAEQSRQSFELVNSLYNKIDDKARISAGDTAAGALALASNDNAIPYAGEGYERIFALHSQALNYLALGDVEGATVELRRAANVQRRLELEQDKAISKAEQEAKDENIDLSHWQQAPELVGLSKAAGQVKSSFLSAYTYYTSAVIWEAVGDSNAALVDYKKALEINPNNQTIQQDIIRVDRGLRLPADKAQLIIFYEDGFINDKKSFDFSWPYFTRDSVTYFNLAFPYYEASKPARRVKVYQDQQSLGQMDVIADMDAMAAKALMDKLPMMIVRMVLRAKVKHEIHGQSAEQAGILGSLFSTLYNIISEQADRRSWLTMPGKVQMLRTELEPGDEEILLDVQGQHYKIKVQAVAARTSILRIFHTEAKMMVQQYQL